MCNVRVRLQTGGVNTFVAMHDAQLSYVHTGVSARVRASTGASCVMIGLVLTAIVRIQCRSQKRTPCAHKKGTPELL